MTESAFHGSFHRSSFQWVRITAFKLHRQKEISSETPNFSHKNMCYKEKICSFKAYLQYFLEIADETLIWINFNLWRQKTGINEQLKKCLNRISKYRQSQLVPLFPSRFKQKKSNCLVSVLSKRCHIQIHEKNIKDSERCM